MTVRYKQRTHRMWEAHEDVILQEAFQNGVRPGVIAKQLNRTVWSVTVRMNRLLGRRQEKILDTHFSVRELAREMGVPLSTTHLYIRSGLKSYERGNAYWVTSTHLLEWLADGNWQRKMKPTTDRMRKMIADAKEMWHAKRPESNFVTRAELMEAFGVPYQHISNWTVHKGFPKEAYTSHRCKYYCVDEVSKWANEHQRPQFQEWLSRRGELNSPTHQASTTRT